MFLASLLGFAYANFNEAVRRWRLAAGTGRQVHEEQAL